MTSSLSDLAIRLLNVERQLRAATSTPQLAYSSIEDGSVEEYSGDTLVQVIGEQFDGTHTTAQFNGATPPQPEPPIVDGRVEAFTVAWSGFLENAPHIIPMDFLRVDVHMSAVGAGFTPDDTTRAGSITSPRGGEITISRPAGVTFWFKLVMVSQSGKLSTPSTASVGVALSTGQSSDGAAPADPPVDILMQGGIGILRLTWTPVLNNDPVQYQVYVGTTPGFTADSTTLVETTMASSLAIRALADGTELLYGVTYYAKVLPIDSDGDGTMSAEVSGQMHQVSTEDVSADYVYAGFIIVNQLLGGSLAADITLSGLFRTAISGQRVEMGPFGLVVYDSTGAARTVLSPTSSVFRGDGEFEGLSVNGTASIRNLLEMAKASKLILTSATSSPPAAPAATVDWYKVSLETGGWWINGLVYYSSKFWVAKDLSSGPRISGYSTLGGSPTDTLNLGDPTPGAEIRPRPWGGLTHIGTSWYTLGWQDTGTGKIWYISKYSDTTGALQQQAVYTPIGNGFYNTSSAAACIGTDGTNILIAEFDSANSRFRIQTRNSTTLALSSTLNTSTQSGFSGPAVSIQQGNFDLGAARFHILSRNGQHVWPFDSAGTYKPLEAFGVPAPGQMQAFVWDGFRFWTRSVGSENEPIRIYQHSTYMWTDIGDGQTWYAATGWRNNASGYRTPKSPQRPFIMNKRGGITITAAAIPANADYVDFYLSKVGGATLTNWWLQPGAAAGNSSLSLGDTITFASSNPPATSTFPDETPAQIESAAVSASGDGLPKTILKGDGTGRLQRVVHGYHFISTSDIASTTTGSWTNATGYAFPAEAGVNYAITLTLFLQNATGGTADVHFGFNWTGGGRMHFGQMGNDANMPGGAYNGSWTGHAVLDVTTSPARDGTAIGVGNTFPTVAQVHATYECTSSGTVQLEFAQMVATAGAATSIKRGSRMKVEPGN